MTSNDAPTPARRGRNKASNRRERPKASSAVRTQKALAEAMGVARGTASKWVRAGCPRESDGSFDLEKVRAWRDLERSPGRPRSGNPRVREIEELTARWLLRWRRERAILARIDRRARQGELVELSQVDEALARRATFFRRRMTDLIRRMAPVWAKESNPRAIEESGFDELNSVLRQMSQEGRIEGVAS